MNVQSEGPVGISGKPVMYIGNDGQFESLCPSTAEGLPFVHHRLDGPSHVSEDGQEAYCIKGFTVFLVHPNGQLVYWLYGNPCPMVLD